MLRLNKTYHENCLNTMKRMPNNFIDLTITSPPYDNLRDYNQYTFNFKKIAKELFRITKEGGVVVWIVGDETVKGSETGTSFEQALFFIKCGFNLHDTMIYEKNGASYPAHSKSVRYGQTFEYMFILSKGAPKTINLIKDKKNKWAGVSSFGVPSNREKNNQLKKKEKRITSEYGYRNNIWKYLTGWGYSSPDKEAFEHPAIFPEKLVYDHMITWSNVGDIVYDPCMGSGTTAKVCFLNGRKYLGSETSKKYYFLIKKRMKIYKRTLFHS